MITVIGAGSGEAKQLSLKAWEELQKAESIVLQTEKLPLSAFLDENNIPYRTLDHLYEEADDFDDLNKMIAAFLEKEANVTYVVHGNALDDSAVALLQKDVMILPGVSVADQAAAFCRFTGTFQTYTSTEILAGALPDRRRRAVITCLDSPLIAGDVIVRLTELYGDDFPALFYAEEADGTAYSEKIALFEADRQSLYNHTACLLLAEADQAHTPRRDVNDLLKIVERLCARDGCPWDAAQTHESLRPYMIEEAYEAVDAIDSGDPFTLADELGDVLLQVVLHAEIAKKCGEFDFTDVTDAVSRKMIRRHPNVFGITPEGATWDEIKMSEKHLSSANELLQNIPEAMPSLALAEKIQYKTDRGTLDAEELIKRIQFRKGDDEETLGDLLYDVVRFCRSCGVHPELALNRSTKKRLQAKNDAQDGVSD